LYRSSAPAWVRLCRMNLAVRANRVSFLINAAQHGGKRRGGADGSQGGLLHPHDAQSGVKVYVDV
jgi:hypothetical protein